MVRVFANDPGDLGSSQVESYQKLKKWYLMPLCLTLSIIRYGSRVKWSNLGKGVAPSATPWCSSYRKRILRVTLDNSYLNVVDLSRGRPEGSFFNSYYTEVLVRAQLLSLDFSTLPLIRTLYLWVLSKEVSSTIFKIFSMTRHGIEPWFPWPLANTLPTRPMSRLFFQTMQDFKKRSGCKSILLEFCSTEPSIIGH